jgi:hypothetical protein
MSRMKKKTAVFLMTIFCLIGLAMPQMSYAADVSGTSDEAARIIFTNTANDTPDLFVTKYVESASELYQAPEDAVFTFVLKLDGVLAKRREYRVFDSTGSEVFQYEDGESTEKKAGWSAYQTDRSGTFTLKAGQTAKFEYIGTGTTYEVTEISIPDQFMQIQPAEGQSIAGTMVPSGARVDFTNLYTESSAAEAETSLVVRKTVSFPAGYEAIETPDFTFCVKIDGKLWTKESYTVTDIDSGVEVESGMTDSNGRFTMKGGCMATFTGIPVNVDYEVTEILEDENGKLLSELENWRSTGSITAEGATAAPVTTAVFTNVSASFAVTKQMEDGSSTDADFIFELSDGDDNLWTGAEYYLYSADGNLEDETIHTTDEQGRFTLKADQTAMFVGIPAGAKYSVCEIGQTEYIQVVPVSASGYRNKTVIDSVEVLPFVNKKSGSNVLNVTKHVEDEEGKTVETQDEFTFVLYRKTTGTENETVSGIAMDENAEDGSAAVYEPVANAVYSIESGSSQLTYQTGADGSFQIKANETARFTSLSAGTYRVDEINLSEGYTPKDGTTESDGTKVYFREDILNENSLDFVFTNIYRQLVAVQTGVTVSDVKWYAVAEIPVILLLLFMLYRKIRRRS